MKSKFNKISIHLLVFLVLISLQFPISAVLLFYHPSGKILDDRTEPTCKDHPNVTTVKNIRNDSIKFSWEQPPCWNNHKVQLDVVLTPIPSNCTAYTYSTETYVENNFFILRNLLPNTKYRYSMELNKQAIPTGNKSIWIDPELPRNIQTKYIKTNGFKISWIKPKSWFCNNFRFEIVLSVPSINYFNSTLNECGIKLNETKSYNIDSTQGEHEIKGLLPYVEYTYWFKLNNAWSPTQTINLVRTKPSAPLQVQNVSFNMQENKIIRISWKPPCRINGNIREFLLNVAENTNQSKLINYIYKTKDNFYDLENITSSTNYVVSIQAVLDSNIKGQVKNITVNSGHIASDPPQNISLSEIGSNSFSLSWNKPRKCFGNIKNYNIHLVSLKNCHKKLYVDNTNVSADDFYTNFDNLLPNSQYSVKIKAITESGNGDWSRYFEFQTLPGQPKNVTYKMNSESVNISWKSPCSLYGNINGFLLNITDYENNLITVIIDYNNETIYYSYEFENITSSAIHDVSIQAVLKNNIVGEKAHINFTTKYIASNPPENFTITKTGINYLEILWNKPQKSFGNIVEYEISLGSPEKEVFYILKNISCNQFEYKFFNLTSNTSYSIKIKANTETGDGKWSPLIVSKTKELGLISNIRIKNVQSNSFSVIWNKTDADNVKYNISLNKLKPNYSYSNCKFDREIKTFISEDNSYNFTGLQPFYNYSVTIAAILLLEEGQFSEPIFVSTLESIPMKPRNLKQFKKDNSNKNRYNVSEIIKWSAPCRKNGIIKGFHLSLEGSFTEDNSIKYLKSIVVDSVENKEDYSYTIKNLNSSFNYEVFIQTSLSKEIKSDKANVTFTTSEWYPEAPESVKIADQSESHIFVTWKKPAYTNGKIISYAINFTSYGQVLANFKEHCSYKDEIYSKIQNTEELLFNFTDLLPHSNYSVAIKANTSVGYGKYLTEIYGLTKDAAPEQPQNFTLTNIRVNQQKGSVDLNWSAPCHQNGRIKEFTIKVKGLYSVNDSEIYSMSKNVNFSNDTFFYALSISDLIPSCNYTAQVFAISENGLEGKISEETFSLHSGIPEPPSNVELNVTKNILMLSWKNSPTPVGEIVKYQIFIIPPHNYCNIQEVSDVELLTDLNQTYYTVSIAASTGENKTGLPRNETGNVIYGSSSDDYDASLTLEGIAICKQSKAIKRFDIIIEKNYNKTDVKLPDNSNELVKSHFQLYRQYGTITTNYIVRILIQFESDKGKIENDLTIEEKMTSQTNESSEKYLLTISIVFTCIFLIIFNVSCYLYLKNNIQLPNNYRKKNILIKNFNKYYKKLVDDPKEIEKQFNDIDDLTRIKFEMLCNNSSDQLNGSFIKGYSGKDEYIAIQEPTNSTNQKFWKMILRENIELIVMVSQFDENNLENGFQYIPSHQKTMKISIDTEIRCTCEQNFETHCIRTLQLRKDCVQRNIIHMQLLDWPDGRVPSNMENYLNFCKNIRERFKKGLIVVQSSSGAGRTGTLIATDILLQAIKSQKSINIYRTVLELRMQRLFMVQTEDQYKFIHSCIKEELANWTRKSKMKEVSEPIYENVGNSEVVTLTPLLVDEPIYEEIV